jgi:uncharacterized protein YecE (DUF72 family)
VSHGAAVHVGLSGFKYPEWRGAFYPADLPQKDELSYAAHRFRTLELNGPFYSLKRPEDYRRWYSDTPPDFFFAVKGGRFITHMKKLRNVETPLANFLASGVLCLEEKLGPILWQFPANLRCDGRFEDFFGLLPHDTWQAAELASRHEPWLRGRVAFDSLERRPMRYAVEIRDESCATPEFVELLRRNGIALVVADTGGRFPYAEDVTAGFVYVRLHGSEELYASGYSPRELHRWSTRIRAFHSGTEPRDAHRLGPSAPRAAHGRDVYVYFDNTAKARAPFDAIALMRELAGERRTRAKG